jgi:hypothetical protein|tara:strand:- start:993 stop:1268 length:276 start_codon:yes stop_codon:yes gene_type:complete
MSVGESDKCDVKKKRFLDEAIQDVVSGIEEMTQAPPEIVLQNWEDRKEFADDYKSKLDRALSHSHVDIPTVFGNEGKYTIDLGHYQDNYVA